MAKEFYHPKQKPVLRNVSSVFCTVYHHESCASNPDLKFQWKLCFKSWPWTSSCELCYEIDVCALNKPTNIPWSPHLNFVTKLRYVLWHKPSNFTWTSNFTAVFALMFSPTCQKAKFKRKIISIHTNSFIIITCPSPVLLFSGFGQVG
jgi:hypothetical protein